MAKDVRLEELLRKVAENPGDAGASLKLGDHHQKVGQVKAAVVAYAEAARLLEERGLTLKAVAVWSTVLTLAPEYADGHMRQALGFHTLAMLGDAIAALRRAADAYSAHGDSRGEMRARQLIEAWTRAG